jgi:hypothetical protein
MRTKFVATNSQKMLKKAFKRYKAEMGEDFGMSKLAKAIGKPYSTVYTPLMDGRMCNAQTFLDLMAFFGCKSIEGEKLDEAKF